MHMDSRFIATGHRPVTAESPEEAARVIAERLARRSYGRRGYCRVLRLDSWTQDGSTHHYQAFVGRAVLGRGRRPTGECAGHNEWVTVHRPVARQEGPLGAPR
jgi:hypothetical protein